MGCGRKTSAHTHAHTQITAGIKRKNLQAIIFNSRFKTPLNHVKD